MFLTVLCASVAWIAIFCVAERTRLSELSQIKLAATPPGMAPGSDSQSPPRILNSIAMDGYMWIRHAQDMAAAGEWRWRHTNFDNAPQGREVHWNSGLLWALIGLGWMDHVVSGRPLPAAIQHTADWVNPLLLVAVLVTGAIWVRRVWGTAPACLWCLGVISSRGFLEGFLLGYPDHHGQHNAAIALCILGLLLSGGGWVGLDSGAVKRSSRSAREHGGDEPVVGELLPPWRVARVRFALAGTAAGFGLWVSAFTLALVFLGIAVGAVLVQLIWGRRLTYAGAQYRPELWRWWGGAAAASSLLLYVMEYFPGPVAMRLEVNHPLYALLCWGLGEILCHTGRLFAGRGWPRGWRQVTLAAAGFLASAALPIALMIGGARWYAPLDPFMLNLHAHIVEFLPLWKRAHVFLSLSGLQYFWGMAVIAGATLVLVSLPQVPGRARALLGFAAGAASVATLFFIWQSRWVLVTSAVWVAAAPALVIALRHFRSRWTGAQRFGPVLLAIVLVSGSGAPTLLQSVHRDARQTMSMDELRFLLSREIAKEIRRDAGPSGEVVLLAPPNIALAAAYFGDFRTVGTLYWENHAGLRKSASILASLNDEEALRQLQSLGVTHLAFSSGSEFLFQYFRLLHPEAPAETFFQTLGGQLLAGRSIPRWLRVLPFQMPPATRDRGIDTLVLAVDPDHTFYQGWMDIGAYFFVNQRYADAEAAVRGALAEPQADWRARLHLAECVLAQGRAEEALDLFEEAIVAAPEKERAPLWLAAANSFRRFGQWTGAVSAARHGLAQNSENRELLDLLGWLHATAPDDQVRSSPLAFKFGEESVKVGGETAENLSVKAAAYAESGDFGAATLTLRRALDGGFAPRDPAFRENAEEWLRSFENRRPWRDGASTSEKPPPH